MPLIKHLRHLCPLILLNSGITVASLLLMFAFKPVTLSAQQKPSVAGDYAGQLGPLHLKLHINVDAAGAITGTLDSTDQGAIGLQCAEFHLDAESFSFSVPEVHGTWKGKITAVGLEGAWDQGVPQPLSFSRDTFVPAAKPSRVDGIWLGTLQAGAQNLRIQIHVKSDSTGQEFCTLDSLDQGAMGLQCDKVHFSAPDFSFEIPLVQGGWAGKLSADGNSLSGTWSQGPRDLTLTRQSVEISPAPIPAPAYDAAMPAVSAAELQAVMDKDLAEALKSGQLAPSTGAGISIAVVEHGVRRVFSYGAAKPDSIFEIGSVTKTFTGLILSQLVEQGKVKFDEPVRELLPPGTVTKPAGDEITLLDLATQHSGLPGMPDNFKPADMSNPYADYAVANLYAFLAKQTVAKPAKAGYLYSNLGFGLLGQALANRSGLAYSALLKEEVTVPLGLSDTTIGLSPEQQTRFLPGHDGNHQPAHAWDLDALAGAGAIRSTASDILTYLEANLHPESLKPAGDSAATRTLASALVQQHELRADVSPGVRIALAWMFESESGNYWHNGATGGYTAYALFNPKGDYAAVVLLNTSFSNNGSFADRVGQHISQRLAGKAAISLAN